MKQWLFFQRFLLAFLLFLKMWKLLAVLVGCCLYIPGCIIDGFFNVRLSVKVRYRKCQFNFCTTEQKFFCFSNGISLCCFLYYPQNLYFIFVKFPVGNWNIEWSLSTTVVVTFETVLVDSISLSVCLVISPFLWFFCLSPSLQKICYNPKY